MGSQARLPMPGAEPELAPLDMTPDRELKSRPTSGAAPVPAEPEASGFGPLPVLWRDAFFAVVYKPSGLLVHRSAIDRSAEQFALQLVRDQLGVRVHPVHRLDKPTAGLLMFALRPVAAKVAMTLFESGEVAKRYLAVARGHSKDELTIASALADVEDPTTDALATPDKPARRAVTLVRTLARVELPQPVGVHATARYSLVDLTPLTGRRHQLRRHLKRVNHPLVGDTSYGDGRHNRFFRENFACNRLMLCAVELSFLHPFTGDRVTITTAPDDEFLDVLAAVGWSREAVALAESTFVKVTPEGAPSVTLPPADLHLPASTFMLQSSEKAGNASPRHSASAVSDAADPDSDPAADAEADTDP